MAIRYALYSLSCGGRTSSSASVCASYVMHSAMSSSITSVCTSPSHSFSHSVFAASENAFGLISSTAAITPFKVAISPRILLSFAALFSLRSVSPWVDQRQGPQPLLCRFKGGSTGRGNRNPRPVRVFRAFLTAQKGARFRQKRNSPCFIVSDCVQPAAVLRCRGLCLTVRSRKSGCLRRSYRRLRRTASR